MRIMIEYINYFLSNYLQTEKDTTKPTIHKYKADFERLSGYLSSSTAMHTIVISTTCRAISIKYFYT